MTEAPAWPGPFPSVQDTEQESLLAGGTLGAVGPGSLGIRAEVTEASIPIWGQVRTPSQHLKKQDCFYPQDKSYRRLSTDFLT